RCDQCGASHQPPAIQLLGLWTGHCSRPPWRRFRCVPGRPATLCYDHRPQRLSDSQSLRLVCVLSAEARTQTSRLLLAYLVSSTGAHLATSKPSNAEYPADASRLNLDAAFAELRPAMLALAYRITGSRADAEDIVQDAFLRLHNAELIEAVRSLKAYVTTITA